MKSGYAAVIECSNPPGLELIARGGMVHCQTVLERWVTKHPPGQYDEAYVLRYTQRTVYEPGVGVYTVSVNTGVGGR